jgi:hypothetical protein
VIFAARAWIALSAFHGRALCPLRPPATIRALMLPDARDVERVGRRLHDDRQLGVAQRGLAVEQRRQRALGVRQLLAREEDEPERRPASASSTITASAPFMSAAPSPWTRLVVAAAREVVLRGDRVEVPGEHDRRLGIDDDAAVAGVAGPQDLADVGRQPRPRRATRWGRRSSSRARSASRCASMRGEAMRYCGIDVSARPDGQQLCTLHERRGAESGELVARSTRRARWTR